MPFTILNRDITLMEVDAIVNSTNNYAYGAGGADYAIYKAAGPELIKERSLIGSIPVGTAAITRGYNLPAKHIIHVVAPKFMSGHDDEEQALVATYMAALNLAAERKVESIAFPLIASGKQAFPWMTALRIALSSVRTFLEDHEMMIYVLVYEEVRSDDLDDVFSDSQSVFRNRSNEYSEDLLASVMEERREQAYDPRKVPEETFAATLFWWIDELDLEDTYVYKKANLDRKLFSKIRNKQDYQPSKITAIALALALELKLKDANTLLAKAGYVLSPSQKFDRIIIKYINQGNFDIYEINATLFSFGLKMIGIE